MSTMAPPKCVIDLQVAQSIADKFNGIRPFQRDERGLVGRDLELLIVQTALIAKMHPILYGPPGVAKTMTVDGLMMHLPDLSKFKTQAYKASPPEQFLGQVSFKGMAEDRMVRIIKGKLPGVEVAVIDELPRAPRAVLPAFQGMMVEREFDSGDGVQKVPLTSLVGTANHIPQDPELGAFLDRFGLKVIVMPPQSQDEFVRIMELGLDLDSRGEPDIPPELTISTDELHTFQDYVEQVRVPREILIKYGEIWANLVAEGIMPSVRRYRDGTRAMRTWALLDGRDECMVDDLQVAQHVLWTFPEQQATVYKEVVGHASEWVKKQSELMDAFQETLDRLGQVQQLVAGGADTTTKVEIKDSHGDVVRDAGGNLLSITDHAIKVRNEQRALGDLVQKHIDEAGGRSVESLEAVLAQIDGAAQWIGDRILGGLVF